MAAVHDRMPAIIEPEAFSAWLDNDGVEVPEATALLRPAPDEALELVPIGPAVNRAANDDPAIQSPVGDAIRAAAPVAARAIRNVMPEKPKAVRPVDALAHADGVSRCPWAGSTRSMSPITTRNGACPNGTTARCSRSSMLDGVPGRPLLDHHPAQAPRLPRRFRRLRSREDRPLRPGQDRGADGATPASCATAPRSRRRSRSPASRSILRSAAAWRAISGASSTAGRSRTSGARCARFPSRPSLAGDLQGFAARGAQFRRPDHHLRLHAGDRHGQRPSRRLPSPRRLPRARRRARRDERRRSAARLAAHAVGAPARSDRSLAARRRDRRHRARAWRASRAGTARRAGRRSSRSRSIRCWSRRSSRPRAPQATRAERLAALLHDAPEYVIGDMISPFKAAIGGDYKRVEARLLRRSSCASACRRRWRRTRQGGQGGRPRRRLSRGDGARRLHDRRGAQVLRRAEICARRPSRPICSRCGRPRRRSFSSRASPNSTARSAPSVLTPVRSDFMPRIHVCSLALIGETVERPARARW